MPREVKVPALKRTRYQPQINMLEIGIIMSRNRLSTPLLSIKLRARPRPWHLQLVPSKTVQPDLRHNLWVWDGSSVLQYIQLPVKQGSWVLQQLLSPSFPPTPTRCFYTSLNATVSVDKLVAAWVVTYVSCRFLAVNMDENTSNKDCAAGVRDHDAWGTAGLKSFFYITAAYECWDNVWAVWVLVSRDHSASPSCGFLQHRQQELLSQHIFLRNSSLPSLCISN